MKRIWRAAAACAAVGLVGVACLRVVGLESTPLLILIIALTPLLLLGAWIIGVIGLLHRSRGLLLVSLALIVLQVLWSAGEFGRSPAALGSTEAGAADATMSDIRVATANVLADNDAVGVLFESLAAQRADVVMLQEITPEQLVLLERTASWAQYPHRVLDARPGAHGSVIVSRLAIVDGGVVWPGGWPMTRALVEVPTGGRSVAVEMINVHVVAPLAADNISIWNAQLGDLEQLAANATAPLVIAGDFNATAQHGGVRALTGHGLHDAHLVAGWGWGATFPADSPVPALLRLDRILVSDLFEVTGFSRLEPLGSDHRPLIAQISLPRA